MILVVAIKNHAEADIRASWPCPILHDFFTLPHNPPPAIEAANPEMHLRPHRTPAMEHSLGKR